MGDEQATGEAILIRPGGAEVRFRIRAVTVEESKRLLAGVPFPRPHAETIRLPGRAPMVRLNTEAPSYVRQVERYVARLNALLLREALRADELLTFDTPDLEDLVARADALIKEFSEAGLSAGDLDALLRQLEGLGGMTPEQIEQHRQSFAADMGETMRAAGKWESLNHG